MLDAGHGLNTPGKRCPDDSMREFYFNSVVANYVREILLKYENVQVDFAHDASGKIDISLLARTNTANSKRSDVYVSIHANAYGTTWTDANGIETFVHTKAESVSKSLANLIQDKLIKATNLKNRGVKSADFHVLKETNMPALLVECGFMTNPKEAALLKSDDYRRKCAKAIADALIEFYNLKLNREEPKLAERGINKVSSWAEKDWKEATENGYFDGTRPGEPITREEAAVVINRLRKNLLGSK